MRNLRRVVVTGFGAITPLGRTAEASWEGVRQRRVGYATRPPFSPHQKARFFGVIRDAVERPARVPRSLWRLCPAFARYALAAADEAVTAAGLAADPTAGDPFRFGVVIGTGWGGLDSSNENNNLHRQSCIPVTAATLQSMNNAATAAVSQCLGLRGPQLTPVAACAAGGIAIGEGFELIRSGRADRVLVGGGESLVEPFNVLSIDTIGALSKEQEDPTAACCPFDRRRSGFVLSEGAAVLVLEELAAARRRGAPLLGEVTGYGCTTDAHDFTAPAPDLLARAEAIRVALAQAGLEPAEIDYVNAHGTSTPLNDLNESEAIKRALGPAARAVPVSSTKSYTGHLIGAAGAIETVFCLQAIRDGLIPATRNLLDPDPACDLDYVPNEHRAVRLRRVLNLSFGFGGANSALVIEEVRS